jgi:hypothetical protein
MDVGTAVKAFKHPGDKDFFFAKGSAANGAAPFLPAVDAVYTAAYMHQAVAPAGNRGKGMGLYQFTFVEPAGTDRAYLGDCTGGYGSFNKLRLPVFAGPRRKHFPIQFDKQGVAEPEQHDSHDNKK